MKNEALSRMRAKASSQTVETLLAATMALKGATSPDARLARAVLIDAYAEKTTPAEADALMDVLGL